MGLQAIFERARRKPDDVAFIHSGMNVRYGEFAGAIRSLMQHFRAQGVSGIGVICVTSLLDIWLILLALRGCGLTTLSVQSAETAMALPLGDDVCIVTTEAEPRRDVLAAVDQRTWRHIVVPSSLATTPLQVTDAVNLEDEGGHLLLTSGTTGQYKVLHRSAKTVDERSEHHVDAFGTDSATWQYFGALGPWTGGGFNRVFTVLKLGGACVFEQRHGCAAEFLKHPKINDAKVTVSGLSELLEQLPAGAPRRDDLRIQVIGGAAPWVLVEAVRARVTNNIYNNLSSTESAAIATTLLEKPGDQQWYNVMPWREVAVVDDNDQPVPRGVTGQLRVRMLGDEHGEYWRDPETSRRFFRGPYFYPGDLAMFGDDGRLTLQGRVTDVIALRGGDKIATAPWEQALQTALNVSGACLFATPNSKRGEDDFHFVIESAAPIADQVIAAELGKLPVPNVQVHILPALPRNAMGKIDRIALRQRFAAPAG